VIELQGQLQSTQTELQATQSELQTTQAQLQATREELRTTKEELAATKKQLDDQRMGLLELNAQFESFSALLATQPLMPAHRKNPHRYWYINITTPCALYISCKL